MVRKDKVHYGAQDIKVINPFYLERELSGKEFGMFLSWTKDLLKAPYSLKNGDFIIQERFNKMIYGINTITKCCT